MPAIRVHNDGSNTMMIDLDVHDLVNTHWQTTLRAGDHVRVIRNDGEATGVEGLPGYLMGFHRLFGFAIFAPKKDPTQRIPLLVHNIVAE